MSLHRPQSDFVEGENPRERSDPKIVDYTRDVAAGFAKRYLTTYFERVDSDERAIAEFLVGEYRKIAGAEVLLDLGCGPGVQHVIPAVPYVEHIEMADYLLDNLAELHLWQRGDAESHNWNHFTKMILELEGSPVTSDLVAAREDALRKKFAALHTANVLQEHPLGILMQYPAVGFFYCAEAAARTKEQWRHIMGNVAGLVERAGYLFMASLRNSSHYTVHRSDGGDERIPTASINETDFAEILPSLGFDSSQTTIQQAATPDMADHGIQEILLVSARKK